MPFFFCQEKFRTFLTFFLRFSRLSPPLLLVLLLRCTDGSGDAAMSDEANETRPDVEPDALRRLEDDERILRSGLVGLSRPSGAGAQQTQTSTTGEKSATDSRTRKRVAC